MDIQSVSKEVTELETLEARLETGDLTLDEIKGIEDEALLLTDEKVKQFGPRIFSRIGEKRSSLIDREIILLKGKTDIGSKIQRLQLLNETQDPEETESETLSLMREVPLEEDARTQAAALKQLDQMRFKTAHPIIEEFNAESLASNFTSRMKHIAQVMMKQNSIFPFKTGLNTTQQREIYRYATGGGQ